MTQKVFKSSILILSTSKGLVSSKEAILLGLGGKLIYIVS
jgi:ribosomal protein S8